MEEEGEEEACWRLCEKRVGEEGLIRREGITKEALRE